jgi:hypothetical protein
MEDKKRHGGARANSGRLKKDDVLSLIDSMDAIAVPDSIWKALYNKAKDGDTNAIKTWLQYRFGMPKQTIDQNNTHSLNDFDIRDLYGKKT